MMSAKCSSRPGVSNPKDALHWLAKYIRNHGYVGLFFSCFSTSEVRQYYIDITLFYRDVARILHLGGQGNYQGGYEFTNTYLPTEQGFLYSTGILTILGVLFRLSGIYLFVQGFLVGTKLLIVNLIIAKKCPHLQNVAFCFCVN